MCAVRPGPRPGQPYTRARTVGGGGVTPISAVCAFNTMANAPGIQKNPISRLQEIFQQWKIPLPTYREGGGSYSQFGTEVTIVVEGTTHTFSGLGRTKKVSKANAAQEALDYITQNLPHLLEPPPLPVSSESIDKRSMWRSKVTLFACSIDNIDYVTGIGNSSRERYIRAGNPIRVALIYKKNHKNAPKNHKKWPKIMHFSNTFENIYQTETLRSLKLGYPSGQGLL